MIVRADSRFIPLADKSVQCVVTSPPYLGMRDYKTAKWLNGDPACDHLMPAGGGTAASGLWTGNSQEAIERKVAVRRQQYREACAKCGSTKVDAQIGSEPTLEEYLATMVGVFREVKRVLKDDGVLWLNLGDSHAGSGKGGQSAEKRSAGWQPEYTLHGNVPTGLKPKDLIGLPWRVAFALQADGWYLRSDVVWQKPNPMPESCTDRPTSAHEFIFLLSKSPIYFYDHEAIKEPASAGTHARISQPNILNQKGGERDYGKGSNHSARRALSNYAGTALSAGLIGSPGPNSRIHRSRDPEHLHEAEGKPRNDGVNPKAALGVVGVEKQNASFANATKDIVLERNKRDVWTVAAEPAPARKTPCPGCGAPWEMRVTGQLDAEGNPIPPACAKCASPWVPSDHFASYPQALIEPCILAGARPGDIVLDPFLGSGKTGQVCNRLGRRWVGLELSKGYIEISKENTSQMGLRLEA